LNKDSLSNSSVTGEEVALRRLVGKGRQVWVRCPNFAFPDNVPPADIDRPSRGRCPDPASRHLVVPTGGRTTVTNRHRHGQSKTEPRERPGDGSSTSRRSQRHEDSRHRPLDRNGRQANGTDGPVAGRLVVAVAGDTTDT